MRDETGHIASAYSPLGAVLKKRRHDLGLSQEELAGRAGLHRTYITDVERGSRNPSLETIQKLSRALEVPLSILFREIESAAAGPSRPNGVDAADTLVGVVISTPVEFSRFIEAMRSLGLRWVMLGNGEGHAPPSPDSGPP